MKVEFGCPACRRAVELEPGETAACPHCGDEVSLRVPEGGGLGECLACRCSELYRHRDFNQKLGLFLLALGVALWWAFKSFWPMVAAAGIDLLLYFTLPDVAICYRCKAHHRGVGNIKALPTFDLERHEHFRWTKARDEGRIENPD